MSLRRTLIITAVFAAMTLAAAGGAAAADQAAAAGDLQTIVLPAPQTSGGMPLLDAIRTRQSRRSFAPDALPRETLSTLLWAAWGINRPESGQRTAPSARNRQATDLYVVLAEGAYRYDHQAHALQPVAAGDLRALTGRQDFVQSAPVNLVYVERMPEDSGDPHLIWAGSHAGFIGENVYLYCASAGLATVVRGLVDAAALAQALHLPAGHRVILTQTVGFPGS
ncbi:MAG: nitroreductase family protein [Candidatus Krumholzibacteria bacterium]|jgi:nitroreductase|nr:nitroreductase family protein [Candidatus Krumholzibacteria bacterium]